MRVIAIESLKDGVMRYYGEGELLGYRIPKNVDLEIPNPCIKLDNGKYVWGFQCWWGDVVKFRQKYKDSIKQEILVDVEEEVFPKEVKDGKDGNKF